MKLAILAFALLVSITSHAADDAALVRAHYAAVDKAVPKATVVKRDLQGYSAEGGELTAYFRKGAPLKIVAKYYGETGQATEEFYFWQGRLFFILRTSENYNHPQSDFFDTPVKIASRRQERWYFKNGKLWRWIRPGGKVVTGGGEFSNQQENYLASAREMLAGARDKAKIIKGPNY